MSFEEDLAFLRAVGNKFRGYPEASELGIPTKSRDERVEVKHDLPLEQIDAGREISLPDGSRV